MARVPEVSALVTEVASVIARAIVLYGEARVPLPVELAVLSTQIV